MVRELCRGFSASSGSGADGREEKRKAQGKAVELSVGEIMAATGEQMQSRVEDKEHGQPEQD
jgi:hypothetical protein